MDRKTITISWRGKFSSNRGASLTFVLVLIIIVAGAAWFYLNKDKIAASPAAIDNQPAVNQTAGQAKGQGVKKEAEAAVKTEAEVKTFNLAAVPYLYSMTEIKVKKGDRVRINLSVVQGAHDLVIDEFKVRTKVIAAGEIDSVEFTADQAGSFEYYCSVDSHRQMGMVGKLIVAE